MLIVYTQQDSNFKNSGEFVEISVVHTKLFIVPFHGIVRTPIM
jgi:hypothetical protein